MTCKAQQQSDQMFCHECDLRWDRDDPEPPQCHMEANDGFETIKHENQTEMIFDG